MIRVPSIEETDLSQWLMSIEIKEFTDDILWLYNNADDKHTKEIQESVINSQKSVLETIWKSNQNYTLVQTMKHLLKRNFDISFESKDLRGDKDSVLEIRELFENKRLLLQEENIKKLQDIQWNNDVDVIHDIAGELESNNEEIQNLTLKIKALTTFCAVLTSYIRDGKKELLTTLQS